MKLRRRFASQIVRWIRQRLFREEPWVIEGPAPATTVAEVVLAAADPGRPFLFSLPRLSVNRPFVGRIVDQQIALKRRTHPAIWLITPATYYFSGRISPDGNDRVIVEGDYKLRPTLALLYFVYFAVGGGFLLVSALAALLGIGVWAAIDSTDASILLSGLRMLAISIFYLALGGAHIALEKWLDRGNRHAVRALLARAVGNV